MSLTKERIELGNRGNDLDNIVSDSVQGSTEIEREIVIHLNKLIDECKPRRKGDAKPTIYVMENKSIFTALENLLSCTGIQVKYSKGLPDDLKTTEKLLGLFYPFTGQPENGLNVLDYLRKLKKHVYSYHAIEKDPGLANNAQGKSDRYNLSSYQFEYSISNGNIVLDKNTEIQLLRSLLDQARDYNPRKSSHVPSTNWYFGDKADERYIAVKQQSYESQQPFALIYIEHSKDGDNSKGRFYTGKVLDEFSSNFRKTDILIPGKHIDDMVVLLPNTSISGAEAAITKMDDYYKNLNIEFVAGYNSFDGKNNHLWADLSKCPYISNVERQNLETFDALKKLPSSPDDKEDIKRLYVEPEKNRLHVFNKIGSKMYIKNI